MIYPTGTELTCTETDARFIVMRSTEQVTHYAGANCVGYSDTCEIANLFRIKRSTVREALPAHEGNAALVPDSRLLELIRGYVAANSTPTTLPDMGAERHLLKLAQLVVDEAKARLALRSLE